MRWVENMYVDCGNWITSAAMICVFVGGCGCGLAGGRLCAYINVYICVHELCVHVCICTVPTYMCSDCRWVYVKWLKSNELPLFDLYCCVQKGMEGSVRGKH